MVAQFSTGILAHFSISIYTRANVSYFKVKLEMYDDRNEEPLPDVRVLEPGELGRNFARILEEVRELFPCE